MLGAVERIDPEQVAWCMLITIDIDPFSLKRDSVKRDSVLRISTFEKSVWETFLYRGTSSDGESQGFV